MIFEDASQYQRAGLKFRMFHLSTLDLQCSPCRSGALGAAVLPLDCSMALISATTHGDMERGNPRTAVTVNVPLTFQRPGSLSKTEGTGLGGCCFGSTFVADQSLKAVTGMSHSPDPSYVHRAPLRSLRL